MDPAHVGSGRRGVGVRHHGRNLGCLEGHGVLPLTGEPRELPDQDDQVLQGSYVSLYGTHFSVYQGLICRSPGPGLVVRPFSGLLSLYLL